MEMTSGYEARSVQVRVLTPGDGWKDLTLNISDEALFQLIAGLCPRLTEDYLDVCSEMEIHVTFGEK